MKGMGIIRSMSRDLEDAPETLGRTIRWWAGGYDFVYGFLSLGKGGAIKGKVMELATPSDGEKVLDVGCGTGELAFEAEATLPGLKVHAIDASPEMIEVARRKAASRHSGVDFQVAAIEKLP